MIKIPKKQLYKIGIFFTLSFLYFLLVAFFLIKFNPLFVILIFFIPLVLIIFLCWQRYFHKRIDLSLKVQKLQERINIIKNELEKNSKIFSVLNEHIKHYQSLKVLIESINSQLNFERQINILMEAVFNLIAIGKGNCLLYLVDPHTQKLNLFATYKEDPSVIIKAKEGDIFDWWVIKHNCPLLVEDVKKDFRFDLDKIDKEFLRSIGSLIISPLVSNEKILGLIRLDHPQSYFYEQTDLRLLVTISDFSGVALENTKLFEETQQLAIRDSLTGCYTKGYLLERIKEEFSFAIAKNIPLSLLMIDIDHFKRYNDTFGHIAGDIVLKQIGELIMRYFEGYQAMTFRFGGEEFCVLLPSTSKEVAVRLAEGLRKAVEKEEFLLRQKKTSVTISIGVACAPLDTILQDEFIKKADLFLYQAKMKGRNRVCYS
ncbi:MAG: diguanylate cyclase [Candidatus Omnitrophica bacterium]|nr:diguanylate cyclase [Candidatus Omnitrophota bacterium]